MNETVYEFFATCLPGAEKLLADELHGLGVRKVRPLSGGASFFGAPEDALRACLWSRLAGRVNLTVGRVVARDADALYAGVRELPWEAVIAEEASQRRAAQHPIRRLEGEGRHLRSFGRGSWRATRCESPATRCPP